MTLISMVKRSRKSLSPPSPAIYESVAEARKQFAAPQDHVRYAQELLALLPVRRGELLDFGCGAGWLVREANKIGFTASGYDPAKVFVSLGRQKLGLDLQTAFPVQRRFDIIVAKHVLEHISKLDQAVEKIFWTLKPKGYFLVACPNIRSLMYFIFRERWYGLQPAQHVWQFTPSLLPKILRRRGFKIEKVIVNSLDYQPGGIKQVAFWILTSLANLLGVGDQVIVLARKP